MIFQKNPPTAIIKSIRTRDTKQHTEAYSYTELSEVIDDFDVVLAAPQMKCNEEMIRETCEEHGKKYAIIDNYAFSTLDGTKCFELAKNLI